MVPTALSEKLLTADEFSQLPETPDGSRQELVRGVIVVTPPPSFDHGEIAIRFGWILGNFIYPRRLGRLASESGVITETDPDSVRGPDITFYSATRLAKRPTTVYAEATPDLIVEVISPSNRPARVLEKLREYFAAGVPVVWLLNPENQTATVHHAVDDGNALKAGDVLHGEDALSDFSIPVAEIFLDPLA